MASVQLEENLLTILNDDCIYKILEYLSIDDLCSCSRTCNRLRALCNNHFHRKYPELGNKKVVVKVLVDGKLYCNKYVKYLDHPIKNLYICVKRLLSDDEMDLLLSFIKLKCDQNLRQISIQGEISLCSLCEGTESVLCNVEIVEFIYSCYSCRDEATFLQHCPNLTTISLLDMPYKVNIDDIFQQKYPKLKHFHWHEAIPNHLQAEKVKTFLEQNNQIECIGWGILPFNNQQVDISLECIKAFVECTVKLKHLSLYVAEALMDRFEEVCIYLQVLCDRVDFESLHLRFDDPETATHLINSHANQLAGFKQLTKIYFNDNTDIGLELVPFAKALRPLVYLKCIFVRYTIFLTEYLLPPTLNELSDLADRALDFALPQIEVLIVEDGGIEEKMFTYLLQAARHWVNLKKIFVRDNDENDDDVRFPVAALNEAREKLENACELTIYTDIVGSVTNLDHKLVKLKTVRFRKYTIFEKYCVDPIADLCLQGYK